MLNIKTSKKGKATVSLEGEFDIYSAASFKEELMPCLNDCTSIVFDLAAVSEMDTSCFQVLLQAKNECNDADKDENFF